MEQPSRWHGKDDSEVSFVDWGAQQPIGVRARKSKPASSLGHGASIQVRVPNLILDLPPDLQSLLLARLSLSEVRVLAVVSWNVLAFVAPRTSLVLAATTPTGSHVGQLANAARMTRLAVRVLAACPGMGMRVLGENSYRQHGLTTPRQRSLVLLAPGLLEGSGTQPGRSICAAAVLRQLLACQPTIRRSLSRLVLQDLDLRPSEGDISSLLHDHVSHLTSLSIHHVHGYLQLDWLLSALTSLRQLQLGPGVMSYITRGLNCAPPEHKQLTSLELHNWVSVSSECLGFPVGVGPDQGGTGPQLDLTRGGPGILVGVLGPQQMQHDERLNFMPLQWVNRALRRSPTAVQVEGTAALLRRCSALTSLRLTDEQSCGSSLKALLQAMTPATALHTLQLPDTVVNDELLGALLVLPALPQLRHLAVWGAELMYSHAGQACTLHSLTLAQASLAWFPDGLARLPLRSLDHVKTCHSSSSMLGRLMKRAAAVGDHQAVDELQPSVQQCEALEQELADISTRVEAAIRERTTVGRASAIPGENLGYKIGCCYVKLGNIQYFNQAVNYFIGLGLEVCESIILDPEAWVPPYSWAHFEPSTPGLLVFFPRAKRIFLSTVLQGYRLRAQVRLTRRTLAPALYLGPVVARAALLAFQAAERQAQANAVVSLAQVQAHNFTEVLIQRQVEHARLHAHMRAQFAQALQQQV